jgi:glycine amidinotransferase
VRNEFGDVVTTSATLPVVNSFNEWDPLEEVIVGTLDGAAELPWDAALQAVIPTKDIESTRQYLSVQGGRPRPAHWRPQADKELARFIQILEAEGVTVRRPDPIDQARPYATPDWKSVGGNGQSDPRDVLIVLGNEILEATMAWRSRYFEVFSYRRLIKEYFKQGAKWVSAPKPQMADELYKPSHVRGKEYVLTEFEPVFDAADITRCGRDLFVQKSHVTNDFGIDWLQRHLGETFNVHKVEFEDDRALHIDATFVPLAPGKILVNPDRPLKEVPAIFKRGGWEFLTAPRTTLSMTFPLFTNFQWLSMNMLSLDEKRIIVEENEEPLMQALRGWGFEPIPCPFRTNYRYGGSFHCATVDIRRRGGLQSYF